MPLMIKERPPKTFRVVKPRKTTSERETQKLTAGSTKPETLQSLGKQRRQEAPDLTGNSGWRAPSESRDSVKIQPQMNKSYEEHFFTINRGHNLGSVRPGYHMSKRINGADYFKM